MRTDKRERPGFKSEDTVGGVHPGSIRQLRIQASKLGAVAEKHLEVVKVTASAAEHWLARHRHNTPDSSMIEDTAAEKTTVEVLLSALLWATPSGDPRPRPTSVSRGPRR